MKIFFVAFFATVLLFSQFEAKSFNNANDEKRFLGSWINNAINTVTNTVNNVVNTIVDVVVNPIVDNVINPIIDAGNTVINTITDINVGSILDGFVDTVWKPIENTVVDGFNQAVSGVNFVVDAFGNLVSSVVSPTGPIQENVQEPDFCNLRCKAVDQAGTEYFYDQRNGCASKGFMTLPFNFDTCCDSHNECLNSRCCTSDCQIMKTECDNQYKKCLRTICNGIDDFDAMDKCINLANAVSSYANATRCNPTETRLRKLCIC